MPLTGSTTVLPVSETGFERAAQENPTGHSLMLSWLHNLPFSFETLARTSSTTVLPVPKIRMTQWPIGAHTAHVCRLRCEALAFGNATSSRQPVRRQPLKQLLHSKLWGVHAAVGATRPAL